MADDFRVEKGMTDHLKTKRLIRRLGVVGIAHLICLWDYCTLYRTKGNLSGMTMEEIADACKYQGDPGDFIKILIDEHWIDKSEDGTLRVHEWEEHQPFVFFTEERSAHGRKAAVSRWDISSTKNKAAHHAECNAESENGNAKRIIHKSVSLNPQNSIENNADGNAECNAKSENGNAECNAPTNRPYQPTNQALPAHLSTVSTGGASKVKGGLGNILKILGYSKSETGR